MRTHPDKAPKETSQALSVFLLCINFWCMIARNGKELPCSSWINKHTSSDGTADDTMMTLILAYSRLLFLRNHGLKDRQTEATTNRDQELAEKKNTE